MVWHGKRRGAKGNSNEPLTRIPTSSMRVETQDICSPTHLSSPPLWMRPSQFSSLDYHLWEELVQTLIRQTPTTGAPTPARTFPRPVNAPMGAGGRSPSWRRWWRATGSSSPRSCHGSGQPLPVSELLVVGRAGSPSPRSCHGSRQSLASLAPWGSAETRPAAAPMGPSAAAPCSDGDPRWHQP